MQYELTVRFECEEEWELETLEEGIEQGGGFVAKTVRLPER